MEILKTLRGAADAYNRVSLILRIFCGIILGVLLSFLFPGLGGIAMLGDLFVGALKAIAPLLVFLLVISALSQGGGKLDSRFGMVIFYYLLTTFLAAFLAVLASFAFPVDLILTAEAAGEAAPRSLPCFRIYTRV